MPFRSQAQQRFAFGTGQPWAKRWAKQTDFSSLPKRVRKKRKARLKSFTLDQLEAFVSSPHYDPDTADLIASLVPALKAVSGDQVAAPTRPSTPAAAAPAAKPASGGKGESLGPGITRIHGNLCNVHGRYGPCDKALSKKPKGGKGRAARKPKAAKPDKAKNRAATLQGLGISPGDQQALGALRDGKQPGAVSQDMIDKGLVEQGADGSYRMTASGRALLNAADQGDAGRARDTISGATDRTAARQGRQAEHAKRQQDAAGKRASAQMDRELRRREADAKRLARQQAAAAKKPAGGGGGGSSKQPAAQKPAASRASSGGSGGAGAGGSPSGGGSSSVRGPQKAKPAPKPAKPTKEQTAADNRAAVRQAMADADQGLAPGGFDNLIALGQGKEPDQIGAEGLISMGVAERGSDGVLRLTSEGRHAITAANRGDAKAAIDAISAAQQRYQEAQQKKQTTKAETYGGTKRGNLDDDVFAGPDRSFPIKTAQDVRDAVRSLGRTKHDKAAVKKGIIRRARAIGATDALPPDWRAEKAPALRIFKDALGRWRWVSQSSTAFLDRDKEIVSTKALADDCAWSDKTGQYGPLRWWHVPGLDLGDADFNAMHGRVLIESGTFRSESIAQKVASAAADLEISLGFLHLPTEPDADGVFHHIRKFERSLVPRGKASNRFTAFTVKELPTMDETKIAGLKSLGFSDGDIAALQAQAQATEKAADEQQVAFKAEEPEVQPQEITIAGVTYQLVEKAAPPMMVEGSPEEEAAEPPEEAAAEGDTADTGDAGGLTLSEEDLSAIGQAVAQALTQALSPLVSALDLTNKMGAHMADLKGMMEGYQVKKDAEAAEAKQQVAQLTETVKQQGDKLAELVGDQPAVVYRPSEEAVINPWIAQDAALLASVKDQLPTEQQNFAFSDLVTNLFGPAKQV